MYDYVTEKKRMTVFMFGLEDVGKTTIFYKLTLRDNDSMPTIGLKLYEIDVENVKFTIWHAGWTETIKRMWNRYEEKDTESLAVLYVVDSSDKARID